VEAPDAPSEAELLELLSERARQGIVSAIRTLLIREEEQDPRTRALAMFREMTEARRQ
jgi:hypothetical protein